MTGRVWPGGIVEAWEECTVYGYGEREGTGEEAAVERNGGVRLRGRERGRGGCECLSH